MALIEGHRRALIFFVPVGTAQSKHGSLCSSYLAKSLTVVLTLYLNEYVLAFTL